MSRSVEFSDFPPTPGKWLIPHLHWQRSNPRQYLPTPLLVESSRSLAVANPVFSYPWLIELSKACSLVVSSIILIWLSELYRPFELLTNRQIAVVCQTFSVRCLLIEEIAIRGTCACCETSFSYTSPLVRLFHLDVQIIINHAFCGYLNNYILGKIKSASLSKYSPQQKIFHIFWLP